MKRQLCILLSLVMLVSCLQFSVLADSTAIDPSTDSTATSSYTDSQETTGSVIVNNTGAPSGGASSGGASSGGGGSGGSVYVPSPTVAPTAPAVSFTPVPHPAATSVPFSISNAIGITGMQAKVKLSVPANNNIAAAEYNIKYDPTILTPVSVNMGSGVSTTAQSVSNISFMSDTVKVVYSDTTPNQSGGELFAVSFSIREDTLQDKTEIELSNAVLYDVNHVAIPYITSKGSINIYHQLPGDVNLDGKVDISDVLLLQQYYQGTASLTDIQKAVADVLNHSTIDVSSILEILKYIVGLVPRLGTPAPEVTPGPQPDDRSVVTSVIITANQTTIANDGIDSAVITPVFYNKYNERLTNPNTDVYYFFNGNMVTNNAFTSRNEGTYNIYVQAGSVKSSNAIAIKVVPKYSISLSVDKTTVIADGTDKATLIPTVRDKNGDKVSTIPANLLYYIESNYNNDYIANSSFTTTKTGYYYITACIDEYYSNSIRVNAIPYVKLVLTSDKTSIVNDGLDYVKFYLEAYDIDNKVIQLSGSPTFYVNNKLNSGSTFSSQVIGTYTAYAMHNGIKSNEITFKVDPVVLTANPGKDTATYTTFETTLDGSESKADPTRPIVSYAWRMISKPVGSVATLSNENTVKPVFTPDIVGDYVFGMKVSDAAETSEEKTVTVRAKLLGDTSDYVSTTTNVSFPTGYDYNDFIALTDGWVIAKDLTKNKVLFINGISGSKGREYTLTSAPNCLAIDYERGFIFASLTNVSKVAKINVYTGDVVYISTNGTPKDLEVGENGVLFVGGADLHLIDIEQDKVISSVANGYGSAIGMAYDKVSNNLIICNSDSYAYSYRYLFDENDFSLRLVQKIYNDSNKYRRKPKISEDGKHLVYQRNNYTLYDYACTDIASSIGQYNATYYPYDIGFSLDSATLAVDIGNKLMLFNVASYSNTTNINKYNSNTYSNGLSFSRGGKFIYNFENYDSTYGLYIYPSGITQTPVEPIQLIVKPVALISGSNTFVGLSSTLDASKSRMSNGDTLTYNWSLVSKPAGSAAALTSTDQKTLTFTTDVEGEYKFSLVVHNGISSSEIAYKTIKSKKIDSTIDEIDFDKMQASMSLNYTFKGTIPLCDGWIITPDNKNCILITNTLTGVILNSYQLTGAPVSMDLDFNTGTLLVAMASSSKLAKVNIYTGEITYIDMPANCSVVVTAEANKAFVKHGSNLSVVDYIQNKILATTSVGGSMLAFDKVNNFLFSAVSGNSPSALYKYNYNPDNNTITLSQSSSNLGSNGLDLRVSPDGKHLVFCVGSGNSSYVIFDIDPQDITKNNGQWNTSAYPTSGYFTLDSKYFIGSNGSDIKIFDVENHFLIATIGSFSHDYEKVYFSRGSKLIYYFSGGAGYVYKNTWID